MASLLSLFRACARSQRNSCCRALAPHRWDVWGRRGERVDGEGVEGWSQCEWKPQAKYCSFLRRFLFSKMFEARMLLLLWMLFPRAFQHTPFLLGFGIDLGQTLLLLDQAADKSKRLIEPTQLTTGETFVMCVCVCGKICPSKSEQGASIWGQRPVSLETVTGLQNSDTG